MFASSPVLSEINFDQPLNDQELAPDWVKIQCSQPIQLMVPEWAQTVDRRVHSVDISATQAILPGIKPPSGPVGEALPAVTGSADQQFLQGPAEHGVNHVTG